MLNSVKIGILGGSGYGGSELLRLLLFHPNAEIVFVTANEHAGKPVSAVHRNLLGVTDLSFSPTPEDLSQLPEVDVAFFAMPHGAAMSLVGSLPKSTKAIDLSGDFRIDDVDVFEAAYGRPQTADSLQKEFVYGIPELFRNEIAEAQFIANPGCFATATILALAPMIKSGLTTGKIIVDAKTGSSGSGAKAAANTHHPQRANSFYAYKPFTHQHLPEIEQCLNRVGNFTSSLVFMTHSMPVSRGIFASCYMETTSALSNGEARRLFEDHYADSRFVRIVETSPDINWVKMTNYCDIAVHASGKTIAVFSALDNLVKGAAGQAVQNMNLMFGIEETTGLLFPGTNP
ncbi:MAG: N-acetyl-gamma-glutamyl-phosphate reductase [Acidobacteria bacterium ACB1]|nr:N-acetyl-gamma-glutamyl-phosphate reductase [Pyrinomonadaceae bacterium]MCE7961355.1 N-acetyl-gamma-glutamyl-phosphate reductase [Acidobacteria bacterium ACB1]RIJ92438.1 MAG: N-acetyl-gamma-glutamyl-phosphate reductase [Acidobacteriota bacterium]